MRTAFGAIVLLSLLRDEPCAPTANDAGTSTPVAADGAANVCARFYNGWYFESASVSKTGQPPVVNAASGTADFNRNGTFALNYEVAQTAYNAAGKFTLTGDQLRGVNDSGAVVFDVTVACSDTTRRMVLTSRPDSSSVVEYALVAR